METAVLTEAKARSSGGYCCRLLFLSVTTINTEEPTHRGTQIPGTRSPRRLHFVTVERVLIVELRVVHLGFRFTLMMLKKFGGIVGAPKEKGHRRAAAPLTPKRNLKNTNFVDTMASEVLHYLHLGQSQPLTAQCSGIPKNIIQT